MAFARSIAAVSACVATASFGVVAAPAAHAADPGFYRYTGSTPLSAIAPGTVLGQRSMPYHVAGLPTPVTAVQILYRTTDALDRPVANVTTILKANNASTTKAVSYQSFYDSLNPKDGPSRAIAGDNNLGTTIVNVESRFIAPFLLQGLSVVVPDTEGQAANFAAGPEYGYNTLDSMRAVSAASDSGLNQSTKFAMLGYSGGAIATSWAAQLAPSYAPDVNSRLVGAAEGGVLANPSTNLRYVNGSSVWSGVAAMAIAGVARSYEIDFTKYLSDYGKQILSKVQSASVLNVLGAYPGLTWAQMVKPEYADPASVPEYVGAVRKLNMGTAPDPSIPMMIGQGANGWVEGTNGAQPGIGAGDGVMVAGDVRTLARKYCAGGVPVKYTQYNLTSHFVTTLAWAPAAVGWVGERLAGKPAPNNCSTIAPGNPLTTP